MRTCSCFYRLPGRHTGTTRKVRISTLTQLNTRAARNQHRRRLSISSARHPAKYRPSSRSLSPYRRSASSPAFLPPRRFPSGLPCCTYPQGARPPPVYANTRIPIFCRSHPSAGVTSRDVRDISLSLPHPRPDTTTATTSIEWDIISLSTITHTHRSVPPCDEKVFLCGKRQRHA